MELKSVNLFTLLALYFTSIATAVNVNEAGNPITSYTLERYNNNPIRDRIKTLSANVCPEHIQDPGTRPKYMPSRIRTAMRKLKEGYTGNKSFDAGHIIAWKLGGPFESYNFYPQDSSYNQNEWCKYEGLIVDDIESSRKCVKISFSFEYGDGNVHGIPTTIRFTVKLNGKRPYSAFDTQDL